MPLRPDDPTHSIDDVTCLKETANALLCAIDGEEVWIPKSQLSDDSEVFNDGENSSGRLVISEWIAKQKGMI